jgi:hypothetical protein
LGKSIFIQKFQFGFSYSYFDLYTYIQGAEAQSRIKESKVLVCGLRGLNIEVSLFG